MSSALSPRPSSQSTTHLPSDPPESPPVRLLSPSELTTALAVPDLSDASQAVSSGQLAPHALSLLLDEVVSAVNTGHTGSVRVCRASPVTSVSDNYDVLGIDADAVTRDVRYTRYITPDTVLRTHASALVPPTLRALAIEASSAASSQASSKSDGSVDLDDVLDVLLVCPGVVYRRDCVDRLHSSTPHQLDLWRLRPVTDVLEGPGVLGLADLEALASAVASTAAPGSRWRLTPTSHPYTREGRQLDVEVVDSAGCSSWVELAECGLVAPEVLERCGLDSSKLSGLALGLGLDRALMLRKHMDDIRLLRSSDPRILAQMSSLDRYRPVSSCPPVVREVSVAVDVVPDDELLGDQVRSLLGSDEELVESVSIVSSTPVSLLPASALDRLGARPGQTNLLVRLVLRRLDRALTKQEANHVRDVVAVGIHGGSCPV